MLSDKRWHVKDHANQLKQALRDNMDIKQISGFKMEMRKEMYLMICYDTCSCDMIINWIIFSYMTC